MVESVIHRRNFSLKTNEESQEKVAEFLNAIAIVKGLVNLLSVEMYYACNATYFIPILSPGFYAQPSVGGLLLIRTPSCAPGILRSGSPIEANHIIPDDNPNDVKCYPNPFENKGFYRATHTIFAATHTISASLSRQVVR